MTPALVSVIDEPNATAPPPLMPVPAVTVTELFCNPVLLVAPAVFKLLAKLAKLSACVILDCSSSCESLLNQDIQNCCWCCSQGISASSNSVISPLQQ